MLKKKSLMLSVILMLMFVVVGCGQKAAAPSAAEIVQASYQNMSDLKSYGLDMVMSMKIDAKDQGTMDMKMTSDMAVVVKPNMMLKMDSKMDITVPEQGTQSIPMTQYLVATDTGMIMYHNMMGVWAKTTVEDPALVESMSQDPADALKLYTENMEKAEIIGEEKVGDKDCYKINVDIAKEAFSEILTEFSSMGLDESTLNASKEVLANANLSMTLWIDKENKQLLKESMDISELVRQATLAELKKEGAAEDTLGNVVVLMEMQYKNYDSVPEIVLPEEVKNAQEVSI